MTSLVDPNDIEGALLSRIPTFSDTRKTAYIGYRGCGFSDMEAARLTGVKPGLVSKWLESDTDFSLWLSPKGLNRLQATVARDLTRFQWFRNMHLVLKIHGDLLAKAAKLDPASPELSENEQDLLKSFAKDYKPADMLALLRATSIVEGEEGLEADSHPSIQVYIGDKVIEDEFARRAASRDLLNQFTVRDNIVDGESRVVEDE